ncbi:MAG TPA: CHAD domain-containing protein [Solirubrobacteraceae bacterium]|jgi:hypothetical protein|nr:CHAD domain-containing protein [Solirubrobacteraceae bacterium]
MKARPVKGLDPALPLSEAAARIVAVRLDELYSFVPAALEEANSRAQHDMRIAAKRLRYVLEVTGSLFGSYAPTATRHARELQDLLGEIHDCDVMVPRILRHLAQLRACDAQALREGAPGDYPPPALLSGVPNRNLYRGLELLAVHFQARRGVTFDRFRARWAALETEDMRGSLERALRPRHQVRAA